MKISKFIACITLSKVIHSNAFVPSSSNPSFVQYNIHSVSDQTKIHPRVAPLGAKKRSSNDGPKGDNSVMQARMCVRNFLTQRSLQSFMFLLKEMKDPHTNSWIENFLGSKNLLSYHGSGALNLIRFRDWDSVFKEMINEPEDSVIVEIKARGEGRGLSKNNPYRMQENADSVEIEIDIDPTSLANRILSVRDRISKEWASDLELLIVANQNILTSYAARHKEDRDKEEELANQDDDYERGSLERHRTGAISGDFNFGQRTVQSFERDAIYFINNHPSFNDMDATPLRTSSFDLLFLLSMQEAIHRLLESYHEAGEEKEVSFAWLKQFYNSGLEKYFDGNQSFGRADDFMDDLLNTPPALKKIGDKLGFIDPLAIAEDIISEREEVALEWKDLMAKVELDHADLRTEIFRRQMAKWGQKVDPPKSKTTEQNEETSTKKDEVVKMSEPSISSSIIIQAGDFE